MLYDATAAVVIYVFGRRKLKKAIQLMKNAMGSINEFSWSEVYKVADEAWNELLLANSGEGGTNQVPSSAAMELAREMCSKLELPKVA